MSTNPPDKLRRVIAMPGDLWREIEAYRQREALGSVTEAVRRLVLIGLRAVGRKDRR